MRPPLPPPLWTTVPFDGLSTGSLPADRWTTMSTDTGTTFSVASTRALSGANELTVSQGASNATARAWLNDPRPADVEVSAAAFISQLTPAQVIARGSNLASTAVGTTGPSYYAVQVTRGPTLSLVAVANGAAPVTLGQVSGGSGQWYQDGWVRETLRLTGSHLQAQHFRVDTGMYFSAAGVWQSAPAWALDVTDTTVSGAGLVGVGRQYVSGQTYSEVLSYDDFSAAAATTTETYDSTTPGAQTLPSGWAQWSDQANTTFGVSAGTAGRPALSANNTVTIAQGPSNATARAWLTAAQPADTQVSTGIYLTQATPVEVIARGSNLGSTTVGTTGPSYYALRVVRGSQTSLVKMVNGTATDLGLRGPAAANWYEGGWIQATLSVSGTRVQAQLFRADTSQYFNSAGQWQLAPAWALDVNDNTSPIVGGGLVGVGRFGSGGLGASETITLDNFAVAAVPSETFDLTAAGAPSLPAGWSQWTNTSGTAFAVTAATVATPAWSPSNSLTVPSGPSNTEARAWLTDAQPADVQVGATLNLLANLQTPPQVIARGQNLSGAAPTYYAVQVIYGGQLKLVKVVNGSSSVLPGGSINSTSWIEGLWVRETIDVNGTEVRARLQRLDNGQYLTATGAWQAAAAWALDVQDTTAPITGSGLAGVGRTAGDTKAVTFDDFSAVWQQTNAAPPPPPPDTLPKPDFTNSEHYKHIHIAELAYFGGSTAPVPYDDNLLKHSVDLVVVDNNSPYIQHLKDPALVGTKPPAVLVYTNYSNIYTNSEQDLFLNWLNYADTHGQDREAAFYHVKQEIAFSGGSGSSQPVNWFRGVYTGSTQLPITGLQDYTSAAEGPIPPLSVPFPGTAGSSLYIGYSDPFRELNFDLSQTKSANWASQLEYPTAVDGNGVPTTWALITPLTDTTNGFTSSGAGRITFTPVLQAGLSNKWVPSSLGAGSKWLYYVRERTTASGTAPISNTILGRNYGNVAKNGDHYTGSIPAFDSAKDSNHDGYLDETEWAIHDSAKTARFAYESRAQYLLGFDTPTGIYSTYGPMRFAVNPANSAVKNWAAQYGHDDLTTTAFNHNLADGLWVDNSVSLPPANGSQVLVESAQLGSYANDYADLLFKVGQAISPHWLMANTNGSGLLTPDPNDGTTTSDPTVQKIQGYYEENGIRPFQNSYVRFEFNASLVAHRAALATPQPIAVIDSMPSDRFGNAVSDRDRREISTLAYFYLIANPRSLAVDHDWTFLDFFGGWDPENVWTNPTLRNWSDAVTYDVGRPTGPFSVAASGQDPVDPVLNYKVYQRNFSGGQGNLPVLVLFKPLAYLDSAGRYGSLADNTGTSVTLPASKTYQKLKSDGTLDPQTVSGTIVLPNGKGVILVQVSGSSSAAVRRGGPLGSVAGPGSPDMPKDPAPTTAGTPKGGDPSVRPDDFFAALAATGSDRTLSLVKLFKPAAFGLDNSPPQSTIPLLKILIHDDVTKSARGSPKPDSPVGTRRGFSRSTLKRFAAVSVPHPARSVPELGNNDATNGPALGLFLTGELT